MNPHPELTKSEKYVLGVIEKNPGSQNDEMRLLEAVWLSQGWKESKDLYRNLIGVMHAETVARARRKLHQYGLIEYSPTAMRRRTKRFKEETERHGQSITAKIMRKIEVVEIDGELVTRFV